MAAKDAIHARIAREAGVDLGAALEQLSGTDLKSVLLEVFARRAKSRTPAEVLAQYGRDPLVRPAPNSPTRMLALDLTAYDLAESVFQPIELAPMCPLGTVVALSPISQHRVVTTIRNTEVVSDCTNVLALECAFRRKAKGRTEPVRLCTSHRLARPSVDLKPGDLAHFRIFSLASATRRAKGYSAEWTEFAHHLRFYVRLIRTLHAEHGGDCGIRVAITDFENAREAELEGEVMTPLRAEFPDVAFEMDPSRTQARGYYPGVCLNVLVSRDGRESSVADGGFVDWTQQLLNDRHERLLISGIGTDRLAWLFSE